MNENKGGGLRDALCNFQSEIESIERTSGVDFTNKEGRRTKYDYVDLSATLDYVLPKLTKHGLVLTTTSVYNPIVKTEVQKKSDGTEVTTTQIVKTIHGIEVTVVHVQSGDSLKETFFFDSGKETADIKDIGAQLTYKRRYAIFTLLCLSAKGEDDDAGNGGQPKGNKGKAPDPENKKDDGKAPNAGKKSDAEIQAEFKELGLDAKDVKEALTAINIKTMGEAIVLRRKYASTQEMLDAIAPSPEGSGG